MIEFHSVTISYPGAPAPAVKDFSLKIPGGKTTVIVGPSGCGKTTLLRSINRMVEPDTGRITIAGDDIAGRDPVKLRRGIGYVMQNSGLLPHKTALENVAAVARLSGASKAQARERAAHWLSTMHLDPSLFDRYPAELSGGQAQRVGVARGLVANPDIILMDEPFGAVDPVVRRGLQEEVLDLTQRLGKTVVMVTHDIDEAFLLGDAIVLLGPAASIQQTGSADDFILRPANEDVAQFVGVPARSLRVEHRDGRAVVVDAHGKVTGVIAEAAAQAGQAGQAESAGQARQAGQAGQGVPASAARERP